MQKILKHDFCIFLYAVLSTFFFTFTVTENGHFSLFSDSSPLILTSGFFIFLFWAYRKIIHRLPETSGRLFTILAVVITFVFTLFSVMGVFYSANADIKAVMTSGKIVLSETFLVFLGGLIFFYLMIKAVSSIVMISDIRIPEKLQKLFSFLFEKNCFLKCCLCIGIFWLPHLVILYPFALPVDGEVCLLQYYGVTSYTTQHPIIYTQLLGRFADLGAALGNAAAGLTILAFIQVLCLLMVLAYTISTMEKFRLSRWWQFGTLVIFCIVPVFVGYSNTLIIDIFYNAAFLLLINEMVWYLFKPESFRKNPKHIILTVIAVLGMFFRQNGFHVMAVIILFTACRELWLILKKQQKIRRTVFIIAILVVPLCIGKLNTSFLYNKYEVKRISTRAMFALPMQQTARYMVYHSDDLSEEELASIQAVIKYSPEEYKELYKPYTFDGIKHGFKNDVSSEELSGFLHTWIKLFFRHPGTCISATLNQNYCLFSPLKDNIKYYSGGKDKITKIKNPDFSQVYQSLNVHKGKKQLLLSCYSGFCQIPFLGFCVNQGITDFLLLVVCLYALCRKNGKLLLLGLPLLLTLAITFIGPAALGHPRYTFPIIYSLPLFLGIWSDSCRNSAHHTKKGEIYE